jgi:hypothetical protein
MRPKFYTVIVDIGTSFGDIGRGSVTTDLEQFTLQKISHQIAGADDNTLFQDGEYLVSFRDDLRVYVDKPSPADLLFGSVRHGMIPFLPAPIAVSGNKTFSFDVSNLIDRSAYGPTFKVAFILSGVVTE